MSALNFRLATASRASIDTAILFGPTFNARVDFNELRDVEITLPEVDGQPVLDLEQLGATNVKIGDDDQGPITAVSFIEVEDDDGATFTLARLARRDVVDDLLLRLSGDTLIDFPDAPGEGFRARETPAPAQSFVVAAAPSGPTANDDAFTTEDGVTLTVNAPGVLDNDTDPDGDRLTVVEFTNGANGSVSNSGGGGFIYTPNAGFVGVDSFTYTITDGVETDTATVTVTVTNEAPTANDDGPFTTEDGVTLQVNAPGVLDNDTDPDGDRLTVVAFTDGANGSVSNSGGGGFSYTPNAGFVGIDSFTYTISDGAATDEATVTVTVTNEAPTANDDAFTTDDGVRLNISAPGVLENDTDPDGDRLTVVAFTDGANGSVSNSGGGGFSYTPNAGFVGIDSFTYTISDGAATDEATVTVTVTNEAPTANDDAFTTDDGVRLNISAPGVLENDTDPDGDRLTVVAFTDGANGSVSNSGGGGFSYTPNAGFVGIDSFTYTISDGAATDEAAVTITVLPPNGAPLAVADAFRIEDGETLEVDAPGLLANDEDPENDPLTVVSFTEPENGDATVQPDGRLVYTPDPGFVGEDDFTYTVSDGDKTATATVTVTVANATPDAVDDFFQVDDGVTLSIDAPGVLANDTDDDAGDVLTVVDVGEAQNGQITVNPAGALDYTPDPGFVGRETIFYTVSDGVATDNATITIDVVNTPPVARDDSVRTDDGVPVEIALADLLANDFDADAGDVLTVSIGVAGNGTLQLRPGGRESVLYTPDAGFVGQDTFTYTIDDGAATATATVTVTVENAAPVARDDALSVERGGSLSTGLLDGVLANDTDPDGDDLTVTAFDPAANGDLTIMANGAVVYTPDPDFVGVETIGYTVSDGVATDEGELRITVFQGNRAPVSAEDRFSTAFGAALSIAAPGVLANDVDPDGDGLTARAINAPLNGELVFAADGSFTYTPDPGFSGLDGFGYVASDGALDGPATSVVIEVAANAGPTAVDDAFETDEDTPLTVAAAVGVLANDEDPEGDALSATLDEGPANGAVTLNPDGSFTYTPTTNFFGEDGFTYTVTDAFGAVDTGAVSLAVLPVNDAPVAVNDAADTDFQTAVSIDVLDNDADVDDDAADLSVAEVFTDETTFGTVEINADGTLNYTPEEGFAGVARFGYEVSDGALSDFGEVSVTVGGPGARTFTVDSLTIVEGDSGNSSGFLNIRRTGDLRVTDTIAGTTRSGTATEFADFVGADFASAFGPGVGLVRVPLAVIGDLDIEGPEQFFLDFSIDSPFDNFTVDADAAPTGSIFAFTAPVGIIDDDFAIEIDSPSVPESAGLVTFTITRRGDLSAAEFSVALFEGTATSPEDYFGEGQFLSLQFAENQVQTTLSVSLVDDFAVEEDETFSLVLSDDDGPVAQGVATILNDDTRYSIDFPTVSESDGVVTFTVTRTGVLPRQDLRLDLFNGSAVAPEDFDDAAVTFVFAEGESETSVTVPLVNDDVVEGDETFNVELVELPSLDVLANGFATILNDDAPNTPPVAVDDAFETDEDTRVPGNLLAANPDVADSDADGDPLTVVSVTSSSGVERAVNAATGSGLFILASGAHLRVNADGSFTYDPFGFGFGGASSLTDFDRLDTGELGVETFTYVVTDGNGGFDEASATITVTGVNDAPIAVIDSINLSEDDAEGGVNLLNGDIGPDVDPEGGPLTITQISLGGQNVAVDPLLGGTLTLGSGASITVLADGTAIFLTNGAFEDLGDRPGQLPQRNINFTYTVADQDGLTDTALLQVFVAGVNDGPTAVDDGPFAATEGAVTDALDILANDSDPEGDALTIVGSDAFTALGGEVIIAADGKSLSVDYGAVDLADLGEGETRSDSFGYAVSDGDLAAPATVTLTLTGKADEAGLNEVLGTEGSDRLTGTEAADLIRSLGGRQDIVTGAGGLDVFDFSDSTANGARETRTITDFEAGEQIDVGSASVLNFREIGGRVLVYLDGDRDVIIVNGVGDFDELTFI